MLQMSTYPAGSDIKKSFSSVLFNDESFNKWAPRLVRSIRRYVRLSFVVICVFVCVRVHIEDHYISGEAI